MTHRLAAGLVAALMLAACGGGSGGDAAYEDYSETGVSPPMPVMAPATDMAVDESFQKLDEAPGATGSEPAPDAVEQYIAYTWRLGLRLPVTEVEPVMSGHVEACRAAGTEACIVTNSTLSNQSDDYVSGQLYLRATPDWIETFLASIDEEAEAARGEVSYRNQTAEDLTRTIIDVSARLSAQETLQRRLQDLLSRRDGELGDLLSIERELARVTGEVESIRSQLRALRLRVSMSELSVSYETKVPPAGRQRFNPLGEALSDFFYNLSSGLAGVVTAFAVGLPWLLLLGIMLFIWLRLIWPRIRRKKT